MTREEAIMVLKNEQPHCGKRALFPEEKKYEAYNVAVKALEQEPCNDAISRQAAIDAILIKYTEYERLKMLHFTPNIIKQECADLLTDLPSIQPIRPRGHWVSVSYGDYCSECDHYYPCASYSGYEFHYCPNCGAKMEGQA